MHPTIKKCCMAVMMTAAAFCLSGCLFNASVEDLFCLPQLPPEYTELRERIDAIMTEGGEYAAPQSGNNIQPVQMVDLDSDGEEEAVVFMRKSSDERPLKIYIFRSVDESYEQAAVIEGSGNAIYSVSYTDMDQDGMQELIVGWRVSTELQALTVYSLNDFQPVELIRNTYSRYAVRDLNQDGMQELVLIRSDDQGNTVADYYAWSDHTLTQRLSANISVSVAELAAGRVHSGTLEGGFPALFVTGVEDTLFQVTDILAVKNDELVNITMNNATGVSTEIFRYQPLFPTDIDGDGLTEVPAPFDMVSWGSVDNCYPINWRRYDLNGSPTVALSTYHNVADGWYLILPEAWKKQVAVSRDDSDPEEIVTTFSIQTGDVGAYEEFMKVYTISGSSREYKVAQGNRFVLSRQGEKIYAAELLEANEEWNFGLTEDELRANFKLIVTDWALAED